ncbi:MAG: LPS-assembly protein LptD, partial [Epsilonproteobacteria bacterium]|nr:LPS-assembly protein LptD [Campylobacterota bacterium]
MLKINYKAALIFAIFISFSRAENIPDINSTLKGENLGEFFSESIEQNGSIVYSKGKVVFRYDGNTFIANHATYNRDSGRVELKGDVVIFTNRGNKIYADSLIVETHKENLTTLLNMFEVDPQDFWIYSKVAKKIKDVYHFKNTLFSSCNINSPDWSLIFNRAKYDLKSKYLKLYGAKFYIKKMPLFYFPYLAFSLSKERRSGFLYPK